MAQFDRVTTWEVDGLTNLLAECGMIEGHPWFDHIMRVGTHFCGVTHGVDSVSEMVEQGLSAKFLKAVKAEFPEFPKTKQKKLREVLVEMRRESTSSDESSVSSVTSKRGRKSNFADDVVITWKTVDNPHKLGSVRWHMWEAAYGTENRGDFLSSKLDDFNLHYPNVSWAALADPRCRASLEAAAARCTLKNCGGSTYFNMLVSMGHIEVKN